MILDKFPTTEELYREYWGKKPFIVREYVPKPIFDNMIDGDVLAGLSLEEDIKSRLIISPESGDNWVCHHGPLEEDVFSKIGEKNWSLLVQNVEQYHEGTADLLKYFHFSPRWLMDDVMVSYSAKGGGVGPHMDSYHVFLVQGKGKRKWKISHEVLENIEPSEYIENIDLKVFKNSFDGFEVEVSMGDVIYIPPHFGHEGETIEEAMTFSVGFLGPKLSEIMIEYGYYLENNEDRYSGQSLDSLSSGFMMNMDAQNVLKDQLVDNINSDDFSLWLAQYFSMTTHDDAEDVLMREDTILNEDLLQLLQNGHELYRPEHVKLLITNSINGGVNLAIYGEGFAIPKEYEELIFKLNENLSLSIKDIEKHSNLKEILGFITHLYNKNILCIK